MKECSKCGGKPRYKQSSLCYKCKYERQHQLRQSKKVAHPKVINLPGETWIPINGFEEYYHISNLGRVKSLERFFVAKHGERYPVWEKIIKQEKMRSGYMRVTLSVSIINKKKRYSVHRLVAKHFIPNPKNLPQVNHITGVKSDNIATHLEWSTQKENVHHAINVLGIKYGHKIKKHETEIR